MWSLGEEQFGAVCLETFLPRCFDTGLKNPGAIAA